MSPSAPNSSSKTRESVQSRHRSANGATTDGPSRSLGENEEDSEMQGEQDKDFEDANSSDDGEENEHQETFDEAFAKLLQTQVSGIDDSDDDDMISIEEMIAQTQSQKTPQKPTSTSSHSRAPIVKNEPPPSQISLRRSPTLRATPKTPDEEDELEYEQEHHEDRGEDMRDRSAASWKGVKEPVLQSKRKHIPFPEDIEIIDVDDLSTPSPPPVKRGSESPAPKRRRVDTEEPRSPPMADSSKPASAIDPMDTLDDLLQSDHSRATKPRPLPRRKTLPARQLSSEALAPTPRKIGTNSNAPNEIANETPASSTAESEVINLKRNPDYWYLDGSVVLRLFTKPGAPPDAFCLHESLLVKKSDFFRRLLQDKEKCVGVLNECPVYDIPPEFGLEVIDCCRLWDAMESGIMYALDTSPSFPELASLLHASTVLQEKRVQAYALQTFKRMWSSDLKSLDSSRTRHFAKESIVLARLLNGPADDILKCAFYQLLKNPKFQMDESLEEDDDELEGRRGVASKRKNTTSSASSQWKTVSSPKRSQRPFKGKGVRKASQLGDENDAEDQARANCKLSWKDLARLLQARSKLEHHWLEDVASPSLDPNCTSPIKVKSKVPGGASDSNLANTTTSEPTQSLVGPPETVIPCAERLRSLWIDLVIRTGLLTEYLYDPISGYEELILASEKWEEQGDVLCKSCLEGYRVHWRKGREKLWKSLDTWLCLS